MRWPWRRRKVDNGEAAAAKARWEQERKLVEARKQWPEVHRARDVLGEWVEQALRGGRT
jgi:hypothetical protein